MAFAWSFSKIKNFETCPKKHWNLDLAPKTQRIQEGESEELIWGNRVHKALAISCAEGVPLPPEMAPYSVWVDRVRSGPGKLLVEQKYALTRDFCPTEYFAPVVWYRGIADIVRVSPPVALAIDWKTGAVKEDSVQLALMAQCIFSFFPDVQRVATKFVWLKEDCMTEETYDRTDMVGLWTNLLPRVKKYETAVANSDFPAQPSGLCKKYCPVTSCPYHGKGSSY